MIGKFNIIVNDVRMEYSVESAEDGKHYIDWDSVVRIAKKQLQRFFPDEAEIIIDGEDVYYQYCGKERHPFNEESKLELYPGLKFTVVFEHADIASM